MRRFHVLLLATIFGEVAGCRTQTWDVPRPELKAGVCGDPLTAGTNAHAPSWVGTGDFDRDGLLDIAAVGQGMSIQFGDGSGNFHNLPHIDFPATASDFFAAITDWDQDGTQDIWLGEPGHPPQWVPGRFDRMLQVVDRSPALSTQPAWLAPALLNNDKYPDLVALIPASGGTPASVIPLLQNPLNQTSNPGLAVPLDGDVHSFVATGDLNGDFIDDAIVPIGNNLQILLNDGAGKLTLGWLLPLPAPASVVLVADLNGDNWSDIVAISNQSEGDNVFVFRGLDKGNFFYLYGMHAGHNPQSVTALDWNGDGHLDLAVPNSGTDHSVSLFLGYGEMTFAAPQPCAAVTFDALGGATWVAAGDFNGDRKPDLAFSYNLDGVDIVLNQTP